jgi:hypothetical protein
LTFTSFLVISKFTGFKQPGCRFGGSPFVVLANPPSEEATWPPPPVPARRT